jgi:hypothetical protein
MVRRRRIRLAVARLLCQPEFRATVRGHRAGLGVAGASDSEAAAPPLRQAPLPAAAGQGSQEGLQVGNDLEGEFRGPSQAEVKYQVQVSSLELQVSTARRSRRGAIQLQLTGTVAGSRCSSKSLRQSLCGPGDHLSHCHCHGHNDPSPSHHGIPVCHQTLI